MFEDLEANILFNLYGEKINVKIYAYTFYFHFQLILCLLALVTARLDDKTMKLGQKVHDLVKMLRIDLMELSHSSL